MCWQKSVKGLLDYAIKISAAWVACKKLHARIARPFKGLLDYAIKIAATWVACNFLHARIARPFTLRIQHRAIFKIVSVIAFYVEIVYLKSDTAYPLIFMKTTCIIFSFPNEVFFK